jgi:hypothetical protein
LPAFGCARMGTSPTSRSTTWRGGNPRGTTEWQEYSVSLPVHRDARTLFFGVHLVGTGKVWGRRLAASGGWQNRLGGPAAGARVDRPGSRPRIRRRLQGRGAQPDPAPVWKTSPASPACGVSSNTITPAVTSGRFHWDYELFRILPCGPGGENRAAANSVLAAWIEQLGPLTAGTHAPLAGQPASAPRTRLDRRPRRVRRPSQPLAPHRARGTTVGVDAVLRLAHAQRRQPPVSITS